MIELTVIQKVAIWLLPLFFAITIHEAAHGWVAYKLGDNTAKMLGRLTLNPIKHIDPFGTILVPIMVAIASGFTFVFGWAKPVPFTPANLKNPNRDSAIVALGGPFANLLMALIWAFVMKASYLLGITNNTLGLFLVLSAQAGILINCVLFALNMLPIPPLDGSRVLASILPGKYSYMLMRLEPYGMIIILVLIFTNILGMILMPIIKFLLKIISFVSGL